MAPTGVESGVKMNPLRRWPWFVGGIAVLSCVGAAGVFGFLHQGYSHLRFPLAVLGAAQVRHATLFNLFAFVLPGAFAACLAIQLRRDLPASGWACRIGAQLLLLAAMAFAAQGVVTLDLRHVDDGSTRYHAVAWMLWMVSFICGAVAVAFGTRGHPAWWGYARFGVAMAALSLVSVFLLGGWIGQPLAQRMAYAAWLAWVAATGWRLGCEREGNGQAL
jgi:hypothetical protein